MRATLAVFFMIAFAVPALASIITNICPSNCVEGRAVPETECNNPALSPFCQVQDCGNGRFQCGPIPDSITVLNLAFNDLLVVLEYSWNGAGQRDLDSATMFLDGAVGFACSPSNQYLEFSGDSTAAMGMETATIDVSQAGLDGAFFRTTSIFSRADWPTSIFGPAQLRMFLRKKDDGTEVPGASVTLEINPGNVGGCAETNVAEVLVSVEADCTVLKLVSV